MKTEPAMPVPRPGARRITIILLWLAATAILAYWLSYFTDGSLRASGASCYHLFERNFPAPDGFIALCSLLAAEALRRDRANAVLWGLLAAGGFFFLALIDISYNLWNGLYAQRSAAMAVEVLINVCSLALAIRFSVFFWRHRRALGA